MITKITNILDIINAHTPVPFGGKPYRAEWVMNDKELENEIHVFSRENGVLLMIHKLSEYVGE